jgi:crotonobetainyl-CoA:carnitine CoA-transferase CaiB-like acyl-CoA transferase
VLGQPALATDERFSTNPRRTANRRELTRIIEESFAPCTAAEVVQQLERAGIANGRVNDVHELAAHEQLRARDRWRRVGTSAGEVDALLPPANIGGAEVVMTDVPTVGQHTAAVLAELGYDDDSVNRLRSAGAI